VIESGAVGLYLEDAADPAPLESGTQGSEAAFPLADLKVQLEKIRAVVEAGMEAVVPLVVNARTDLYWRRGPTPRSPRARSPTLKPTASSPGSKGSDADLSTYYE